MRLRTRLSNNNGGCTNHYDVALEIEHPAIPGTWLLVRNLRRLHVEQLVEAPDTESRDLSEFMEFLIRWAASAQGITADQIKEALDNKVLDLTLTVGG